MSGLAEVREQGGWAPYLDQDERLLWEGAPNPGLRFRPSDILVSLFGTAFLGFALFWTLMAGAMGNGGPSVFLTVWGLPFIAVGVYLAGGRFFWDAYVRSRTVYALTDRRAIIAKSALGRSLKSWPIERGTEIEYRPGDEAMIYFASEVKRRRKGGSYTVKHGFEYIPEGERVYRLIREIQERRRREDA